MVRFRPPSRVVKMYVCGPTPYDKLHVGHARTFIFFDVLARLLRRWGFTVNFVVNFSDISEEVIARAKEEGTTREALAQRFYRQSLEQMRRIHITTPTAFPLVSSHVPRAIRIGEQLLREGWAYRVGGAIFFDASKSDAVGSLSKADKGLQSLRRYDLRVGKRGPLDFIIWEECSDEPLWEGSLGPGRPGWHLQDVAIAQDLFSGPYHIHGGAVELAHPHHEYQEMLGRAYTHATPYVQNWVHVGLVTLGGRKMSKSSQNLLYLDEAVGRWGADALRLALLSRRQLEALEAEEGLFERSRLTVQEICRALVRGRTRAGGLPRRASDAAHELLTHIRMALANGLNPDILLQHIEVLSDSSEGVKRAIPLLEALGLEDCLKAVGQV